MIFKTTPEECSLIPQIEKEMISQETEIDDVLIKQISDLAKTDQGVYDLMEIWWRNPADRKETMVDLLKSLKDYNI